MVDGTDNSEQSVSDLQLARDLMKVEVLKEVQMDCHHVVYNNNEIMNFVTQKGFLQHNCSE